MLQYISIKLLCNHLVSRPTVDNVSENIKMIINVILKLMMKYNNESYLMLFPIPCVRDKVLQQ